VYRINLTCQESTTVPSKKKLDAVDRVIVERIKTVRATSAKLATENIAHRIKEVLKGQNVAALARAMGVSRTAIYDWSTGRSTPDVGRIALFAQLLDLSVSWLITGSGAMRHSENHPGGFVVVTALNVHPFPIAIQEDWIHEIWRRSGPDNDDNLQMIAVTDDAMEPTLKRGDLLIFRRLSPPHNLTDGNNGLYVLMVAKSESADSRQKRERPGDIPLSRFIVRRILWGFDGSITITPDNPAYQSEKQTCRPEKAPLILGPVLWRAGRI
jgi:transcriptional regulator with XRE-family HTH domain